MEFRLADHGLILLTRVRGEVIRDELLAGLASGETVVIDFDQVRDASYSFLDEFVGELAARLDPSPELINVPQKISETIAESLRNRGLDSSIAVSLEAA
jgi:hypothetical protein